MSRVRRFLLRINNVFRPDRAERQLDREIASHLALLEERFRRAGMAPDEARQAARRAFGGVEQAKDVQRDARSFAWLDDTRRDAAYAVRMLRRSPGFTTVAIVTLALGIGAVTVIYSVVRNVLLDPFPYAHSRRMVDVVVRDKSGNLFRGALPAPEFLDYQEQSQAFEEVIGTITESMHYLGDTSAERLSVAWVTPNTFSFLGVEPLLGRYLGPADAAPEAPRVAVLNHRTWMTLFGGDPGVLGRTVVLNREQRTIIGVMPPRFEWHVADLWIPGPLSRTDDPKATRSFRWLQARLRPGVTIEEAEAQVNVIAARRAADNRRDYPDQFRVQVITVIDWVVGSFRRVLYTLFAAVGLLLVIACCNVANMLLARATVREQEMSIRAALGASRVRIIRQLLVESAVLALGGVACGCLIAYGGIEAVAQLMPRQGVPWETQLRLDRPVLYFALATAALATFVFGLFPAFYSARRELVTAVNSAGRSGTANRRHTRMRGSLVIAEVALSIILLLGAGLLARSFLNLAGVELGFDPRNLLGMRFQFAPGQYQSPAEQQRFYRAVLDRLATTPGVQSVAVATAMLGGWDSPIEVPGGTSNDQSRAIVQFCTEGYFSTLGVALVAGRQISLEDVQAQRRVAVVNEALVRRYFNTENPLGRSIRLARLATLPAPVADPTLEIIGVVRDVSNDGIRGPVAPQAYVPHSLGSPVARLLVRTSIEPRSVLNGVRQEIRAIDRQVAFSDVMTMEDLLERAFYAQPRFALIVLLMLSGTGLALVALGVYGVMAYSVSQQTRDIAIRMALGGEQGHVVRMVLQSGLRLLAVGIVAGLVASVATNRLLAGQLWNTSSYDPATLVAVVAVVIFIGACACWIPAHRATRVDPIVSLRHE